MTLSELLRTMTDTRSLPPSRLKDFKTSIRYLATALETTGPDHCPIELILRNNWKNRLTQYLTTAKKSAATIHNTRHNLSALFRHARAQELLPATGNLPRRPLTYAEHRVAAALSSPYRQHYAAFRVPYRLKLTEWPPELRSAWNAYHDRRSFHLRPYTLLQRLKVLELYFGFLTNIEKHPLPTWENIGEVPPIDRFVRWHTAKVKVRMTTRAYQIVKNLIHISRDCEHPHTQALIEYFQTLPKPEPLHNKRHHWFTLAELEQVALSELQDARVPFYKKYASRKSALSRQNVSYGVLRAAQHQRALILRLLIRVPLRQRNIREMRLGRNLYQDTQGHWHLEFRGDELKVSVRNGRTNTLHVDLTAYRPDLIEHLEEFLKVYRRYIPRHEKDDHVFLRRSGLPFSCPSDIHRELSMCVLRRTDKRFYPHLIRTLWVSEFLTNGGSPKTAAYLLNDHVATVLQKYDELMETDHLKDASRFLDGVLA